MSSHKAQEKTFNVGATVRLGRDNNGELTTDINSLVNWDFGDLKPFNYDEAISTVVQLIYVQVKNFSQVYLESNDTEKNDIDEIRKKIVIDILHTAETLSIVDIVSEGEND